MFFIKCRALKELNLSSFNTNKVIKMNDMFFGCCSLKELDFSSFKTDNVILV